MANVQKKNLEKVFGEMPHSLEAEQALLGCILIDAKVQTDIASSLKEEDFYAESHKLIFSAMNEIMKSNQPVDLVTLTDMLEKQGVLEQVGGISYITELTNVIPSSANYKRYFEIVTRDSILRDLMRGSSEIIDNCRQSTDKISSLAFAEKKIFDISQTADTSSMVKIDKVIPDVMTKLDQLANDKSAFRGIPTKFKNLDAVLNGVHNSDLMILAARPAVGKTSLAMNIVENIALQGYSCAVFSLEMSKEQLVQRMICSVAEVSMSNAAKGRLSKSEWMKIAKAQKLLENTKIYIDDSSLITPHEMISMCRRLKARNGLDFVMVDYIQLMTPDRSRGNENRQNEITEISRNLKILAREINVPVLALSQLSRAVESEKRRPQLSDLRESGAIEQDADIVMFIHRPDIKATEKEISEGKIRKNVAEIIIAKHRNGPVGMRELYFKSECTKFCDLEDVPEDNIENRPSTNIEGLEELPKADNEVPFDVENSENADSGKNTDEEIF